MVLTKMVINSVANKLAKHFKLDKVMNYVFDSNDLDDKMKEVLIRLNLLEKMSHPPKNLKCKCNNE
tara:strand:- start:391 stop:588 length:198 start_codon:yes stop_codon:yes gene_type:complete